jgi:hypothetical protein
MHFSSVKIFILAFTCMVINPVQAIDLLPGDIVAPNTGNKQFLLSYLSSERNDLYKNNSVTRGLGIKSEQIQIRTAWTFEVDKYPAAFTLQLNNGSIQSNGSLSAFSGSSGLGDTTLLFALWPYADRDKGEYVALGTYLTVPTGDYQPKASLNLGANRYAYTIQLGYQRSLFSSLQWMTAIDASWFNSNGQYRRLFRPADTNIYTLDQKTLYGLQTGMRYIINDAYSVSAMYFRTVGGEEMIDGIDENNRTDLHRYQLSGSAQLPVGRLILQYGGDIKTQNGFYETSRVILRYITAF